MKRVLLITLVAFVALSSANAQNCNPDLTITEPGVYPEQPDTAFQDTPYEFVFQILALKDTVTEFAGQQVSASIDSVSVNDVIGLPSGFEYSCEPSGCVFDYTKVGCVKLSGDPVKGQAGIYDIEIATTAYARIGLIQLPVPDTADGYQLVIQGDGSVSVFELEKERITLYPNPSSSGKFLLKTAKKTKIIKIVDLQGKSVDFQATEDINSITIDISNTPKGLYIMTVSAGDRVYTKKIMH
jgi:hypothetical protein